MASKTKTRPKSRRGKKADEGVDQDLLRVLGHPLRQRLLRALHDRVSSPAELSRELDEPIGNVAYHMKIMERLGAVELVRTRPVRGAIEHFYRASIRVEFDDAHWSRLPVAVRRKLFDQTLQMIWDDAAAAAKEDGFDDPQAHVGFTNLELDDEGYGDVVAILADTLERVMEAQAAATGRMAELSEDERQTRRTEVVMLHFDRAAGDAKTKPAGKSRSRAASKR
jgi:DNA-binding transcriptional ArsR family regulator